MNCEAFATVGTTSLVRTDQPLEPGDLLLGSTGHTLVATHVSSITVGREHWSVVNVKLFRNAA